MTTSPRGIRNHNPGNIRESANDRTQWFGERATDDDKAFEEFEQPEHGIRAMATVLRNYQRKHLLNTVESIIDRWAPTSENNTSAYVRWVCHQLEVAPIEPIDLNQVDTMRRLVCAIIRHENGRGPLATRSTWYTDATVDAGLRMAGYSIARPITKSKTVAGQAVVGTGTAGAVAVEQLQPLLDTAEQTQAAGNSLLPIAQTSTVLQLICAALIVGGIVLSLYGYRQIRRRAREDGSG